jgi:hypothetical protein
MRRWLFSLALLVLAAPACTPVLRSPMTASSEQIALRDRYFALHPDDPFREAILSGELRQGMSPTQVFLAWGLPFQRVKTEQEQRWVYEFREPNLGEGQPAVVARLFFVEDRLVRWQRDRRGADFRQRAQDAEPPGDLRELPEPDGGKPREP